MPIARCPVCERSVSVLNERLVDLRITLRELGLPGTHAHSSCLIRTLKAALDYQRKHGRRKDQ